MWEPVQWVLSAMRIDTACNALRHRPRTSALRHATPCYAMLHRFGSLLVMGVSAGGTESGVRLFWNFYPKILPR